MKILYVVKSLNNSGPVNVVLELCKQNIKHEVIIIYFDKSDRLSEFKKYTSNIYILKGNNIFLKYLYFRYILKKINPDVIHSHCFFPDLFTISVNTKSKVFSTVHCCLDLDYINEYGLLIGTILYKVHSKILMNKKLTVISCSKPVMIHNSKNLQIKSSFINNGVSVGNPKFSKKSNPIIKLLYIGVLNKRKNVDVILDAFSRCSIKNFTLDIVGNGPELNNYKNKYKENKNINFHGFVSNPREIINEYDFFVSSSLSEGLPMALLESMSEGLSYIISDIDSHKAIYEVDKKSGFIVENKASSFLKAFKEINQLNINKLKRNSYKTFIENFSSKIMYDKYHILYRGIISFEKNK